MRHASTLARCVLSFPPASPPTSHPPTHPQHQDAKDAATPAARKVAALATEATTEGRPSASGGRGGREDEGAAAAASTFCLRTRGLITGAVIVTAVLLVLLTVSKHNGVGGLSGDAGRLATPRRAGPLPP